MNYYLIRIDGKDTKRFIKDLYLYNINLYNIEYINKSCFIKIKYKDYKKLKKIKTIYSITIVKYYGIYKYINLYKKYNIFIICVFLGFILLYLLCNTTLKININTSNLELKNNLLKELKDLGIKKYSYKLNYKKKEKIKKIILEKYKDKISYIEIDYKGTLVNITILERIENNIDTSDKIYNIVASKDGIIKKIDASSGEINTKVNKYVKKGDILVSGIIHKDDIEKGYISAKGSILAYTWYTITIDIPRYINFENNTGNKIYNISFNFFNKNINLFKNKYNNFKVKNLYNYQTSFIPISIKINKIFETDKVDYLNTIDNVYNYALDIGFNKLKENNKKIIEINYNKKLKIEEINSKIRVVIFYKVIEDITEYKEIG